MKNRLSKTAVFLTVVLLVLLFQFAPCYVLAAEEQSPAGGEPAPGVMMKLVPSADAAEVGKIFTVTMQAVAGSQPVAGVDAFVNFNPGCMEVVQVLPNTRALGIKANLKIDNVAGHVDYSGLRSASQPFPTGTFNIAAIIFRCLNESDNALVEFSREMPRQTIVAYNGKQVLGDTAGCYIRLIKTGAASDAVEQDTAVSEKAVAMKLIPPVEVVKAGHSFTVDIQIEAGAQPLAAADIFINFDPAYLEAEAVNPDKHTLETQLNLEVDNTDGRIDYSAGAFPGPVTGTFTAATIAFKALKDTKGTTVSFNNEMPRKTIAAYKGRQVLGETGDCEVAIKKAAKMKLVPSVETVTVGDTFTAGIEIETSQLIAAIDTFIDFDAACLELLDFVPEAAGLAGHLNFKVDDVSGYFDYSTGCLGIMNQQDGNFIVATLTFKALKAAENTTLSFHRELPRKTEVAYAGQSILDVAEGCTFTLVENEAVQDTPLYTAAPEPTKITLNIENMMKTIAESKLEAGDEDINQDGKVDALDITLAERIIAGLDS